MARTNRICPPTRGELRVAAAALPNSIGPRGPFTKGQQTELKRQLAALGKAGKR